MSDLESRVSVVETRVSALEAEENRTRSRLHDLESDRATLRMLVQQMKDLAAQVETVATRAAEKALAAMTRESETRKQQRWSHRLGLFGAGVSGGGLLIAILFHFL